MNIEQLKKDVENGVLISKSTWAELIAAYEGASFAANSHLKTVKTQERIIKSYQDAQPKEQPSEIKGKIRSADPEDFGVPAQYAKCAHNYANWLAAQPQAAIQAPGDNEATRLVCLEAAQKLRIYVGLYTGDKQARRLVDELSNIADALAAPAPTVAAPSDDPMPKRTAFIAWCKSRGLETDVEKDAWGAQIFKHSHIQAMWEGWFNAVAAPTGASQSAGVAYVADFIDKRAQEYLDGNAGTEHDTGAIVWHCGEAGRDYYYTLTELAEEIRAITLPASMPVRASEAEDMPVFQWLSKVAKAERGYTGSAAHHLMNYYEGAESDPPAPAQAIQAQPLTDATKIKVIEQVQKHLIEIVAAFGEVSCARYLQQHHTPGSILDHLNGLSDQTGGAK